MSKSEKLYKDSPKMERDKESGNMKVAKKGISKPTQADAEDMGIAGDGVNGHPAEMPVNVHQVDEVQKRHTVEVKDMHKRHQDEMKDLHKRHVKEISKTFDSSEKE